MNQDEEKNEQKQVLNIQNLNEYKKLSDVFWNIRLFFIKIYLSILIQYIIFIIFLFFLLIYIMDRQNKTLKIYFWFCAISWSLIIYLCSFTAISIAQDEYERRCVWILFIVYVPLIGIYLIILQKEYGTIFINNKYLIYQAIVFGFNFIISIAYHLFIKIYRGWLNFLLLLSANILLIFSYSFTNIGENVDIEKNNVGFNRLLLLSFLMIIYISIFNSEVLYKVNYSPIYLSIIFGYIPFFIFFSLVAFILILGIIILIFGLLLVIFIIIIFLMFIVSLFTTNKYLE